MFVCADGSGLDCREGRLQDTEKEVKVWLKQEHELTPATEKTEQKRLFNTKKD